jgi:hypothetical protein
MASFRVAGPYKVPFDRKTGGRVLHHKKFWGQSEELRDLSTERGCYVLALQASKGATPLYVGKATKTFKQECFNPSNIHKFYNALADYRKGTPVLYFVRHPQQKGKTNAKQIGEIENFLIQNGVVRNPALQNVHGKQKPKWSIRGIVRGGKGKPSKAESKFKRLIGIRSK